MEIGLFPRGIIIGLSVAAPIGPMGVLCIRRTLIRGSAVGFISGLGVATADACFASIAAFGLTSISSLLVDSQSWIRLVGGLFLCYLGIKTLKSRAWSGDPANATAESTGWIGDYCSTFGLTLTNPTTIISFAAIFAGFGVAEPGLGSVSLVLGVFLGSALWWLILALGMGKLRLRFGPPQLTWVNRLSGAVILGFGSLALVSLVA
ncbi:MAG: LysE family translocator [Thermomicrobiales bacterium]